MYVYIYMYVYVDRGRERKKVYGTYMWRQRCLDSLKYQQSSAQKPHEYRAFFQKRSSTFKETYQFRRDLAL